MESTSERVSARLTASAKPGSRRESRGHHEPPGPKPEIAPLTPDGPGLPSRCRRAPLLLSRGQPVPVRCGTAAARSSAIGRRPRSGPRRRPTCAACRTRVRFPTRPSAPRAENRVACRKPAGARRSDQGHHRPEAISDSSIVLGFTSSLACTPPRPAACRRAGLRGKIANHAELILDGWSPPHEPTQCSSDYS
jgi:hypothetical protein